MSAFAMQWGHNFNVPEPSTHITLALPFNDIHTANTSCLLQNVMDPQTNFVFLVHLRLSSFGRHTQNAYTFVHSLEPFSALLLDLKGLIIAHATSLRIKHSSSSRITYGLARNIKIQNEKLLVGCRILVRRQIFWHWHCNTTSHFTYILLTLA